MLRFIAALLFSFQGLGYGLLASRHLLEIPGQIEEVVLFHIAFGVFWGVGCLFSLASAAILFRSRGNKRLTGGGWSVFVVLLTCSCIGLLAAVFAGLGLFSYQDVELAPKFERLLRGLFLALAVQSAFVSAMGFFAALWPYRRGGTSPPAPGLEVATA